MNFKDNEFSDQNFLIFYDKFNKISSDVVIENEEKCENKKIICEKGLLCDIGKEIANQVIIKFTYQNNNIELKLNNLISYFISLDMQ